MIKEWEDVVKRVDGYEEELVRFQGELVACPALGPDNNGQGEIAKAELMTEWCRKIAPDDLFRVDAPDDRVPGGLRPNVIAYFKGTGPGRIWVLSHLDVVPPGERALWTSDPFVLRRDGDLIYGRGVEDNHQGIMSSYFAMKALRDAGVPPARDVGLIFVADEETGSEYGLEHLLNARPDLFSPEDWIIVPDWGNENGTAIEVAEKSMLWLKITLNGRQCHGSAPQLGENTLRAVARAILALDQALPETFPATDSRYLPPQSTFEPTKKEANVPNINTIPGEDVFYLDARVLPQYSLNEVIERVRQVTEEANAGTDIKVRVDRVQAVQAPQPTPDDAPVVQVLSRALLDVRGVRSSAVGIGGGTVAAMFREKGLPTAVWSTQPMNAHQPDESARISNQLDDAKVMAHVYLQD